METTNFRIPCFIKIPQPPLGLLNLDTTLACTQFYRIKGRGGVAPPNIFDRVDEIRRFFMNPALCHAGRKKFLVMGGGGGGGETPTPPFIL